MAINPTFSPYATSVAAGSFNTDSTGFVQGCALDQPSTRNSLAGGVLASTETLPMWGGCGISEAIPGAAGSPISSLGSSITRATTLTKSAATSLTGFSVFDQNYAAVNTPSSPVPLTGTFGQVNFYRLGTGARIPVKCSPNLVGLNGAVVTSQVSWDFANQQLEPFVSTTISSGTYPAAATISSGTYTTGTGAVSLTTNAAHGLLAGETFTISALTGTGAFASLNGTWTATAGTTGSTLNFTGTAGLTLTLTGGNLGNVGVTMTTAAAHGLLPGDTFELSAMSGATPLNGEWTAAVGTTGTTLNFVAPSGLTATISTGTLSSGGALNVQVLEISVGNSMTVNYNATTGAATWNRADTVAIILI